jgi:hypothetical protein
VTSILPLDDLRRGLRAVVTAAQAGDGPPATVRTEVRDLLAQAFVGPVPLEEYLAVLATDFPNAAAAIPIPAMPSEDDIVKRGLVPLSAEELYALALEPGLARRMGEAVVSALEDGVAGQYWRDVEMTIPAGFQPDPLIGEASRRSVERLLAIERTVDAETESPSRTKPQVKRASWWTRNAFSLAALAAALVVGIFVGSFTTSKPKQFAFASLEAHGDVTRGIEDVELVVKNDGTERAFVTVVGLAPGGRRGVVFNQSQGSFLAVNAGEAQSLKNLPPEFEGTTVVLVVLTNVPAGEAVRINLPTSPSPLLSPDRGGDLGEHLRAAMEALNVRTQVRTISLPSSKKD